MKEKRWFNLKRSVANRNDEFYTRYADIEAEVKHYDLRGKFVYSPCDTPESNFVKYFTENFNELGLKYYTATGYNKDGKGIKYTYDGKNTTITALNGDGSYCSDECLAVMDECDVIITNPPFSKIKDFITYIDKKKKQYLLISTFNAVVYLNSSLPMLFNGNLHIGVNKHIKYFYVSDDFVPYHDKVVVVVVDGKKSVALGNTTWITNLTPDIDIKELALSEKYQADKYPVFDGYKKAINVNKVKDIPCDYDGIMGVPVTFLEKWCPSQFEIVGFFNHNIRTKNGIIRVNPPKPTVNGKTTFTRLLIRKIKN